MLVGVSMPAGYPALERHPPPYLPPIRRTIPSQFAIASPSLTTVSVNAWTSFMHAYGWDVPDIYALSFMLKKSGTGYDAGCRRSHV
jgi:hypothetical protein